MGKHIIIAVNKAWNIYNFRLNLARALRSNGYQITLVAPRDEYTPFLEKEFTCHDMFMRNQGTNPMEDLRTFAGYYCLYRRIRPDAALHFTIKPNIYGSLAARLLGIKFINNVTGLGTLFIKESWATRIAKNLYRISFHHAVKVFFQNSDDRNYFIENRLVKSSIVDLLPGSGVDTKKFSPIPKPPNSHFTFLLMARMLWDKGIGEYIEAVKRIKENFPSVRFWLLGPVDERNPASIDLKVIREWESQGLISYLGQLDDVRDAIASSDCVVLPSYYREGTPRSLLEGASMGKPIITTDAVGCREAVEDGVTGFLCRARDSQNLQSKMESILKLSPGKRQKMGEEGRNKIIREFDENIIIKKYLVTLGSLFK